MDNSVKRGISFMNPRIVWTAVTAVALAGISVLVSISLPSLSLALGLAAITSAVLATRE